VKLRMATLGASYEDANRIAKRKSVWLVLWLRARRDGDTLRAFYRRKHEQERQQARANTGEKS
jgi:hypothetical protein